MKHCAYYAFQGRFYIRTSTKNKKPIPKKTKEPIPKQPKNQKKNSELFVIMLIYERVLEYCFFIYFFGIVFFGVFGIGFLFFWYWCFFGSYLYCLMFPLKLPCSSRVLLVAWPFHSSAFPWTFCLTSAIA